MPTVIDVQPTGFCPWACPGCWGADHKKGGSLTVERWLEVLERCRDRGTREIVITGGEPLVYPGIEDLVAGARALGLRVTLSTVSVGLLRRPRILSSIDDLGIPLDGPTPKVHRIMRPVSHRFQGAGHGPTSPRSQGDFASAIRCLKIIPRMQQERRLYSNIEQITVRTVLNRFNGDSVLEIPAMLRRFHVPIEQMRWKVYELNTYRALNGRRAAERLTLPTAKVDELVPRIIAAGTTAGFAAVEVQRAEASGGRYFLLDPNGDALVVIEGPDGIESNWLGSVVTADDHEAMAQALDRDYPEFVSALGRSRPDVVAHERLFGSSD